MTNSGHKATEQRSPKMQQLLGKLPRSLVVGGCVAMAVIFLLLLLAMLLIPYPYGGGESIAAHLLGS